MVNPFKQLGELKKMRDQAIEIQKELQKEHVEVQKHGVTVIITGDQKIISLDSNNKSDKDVAEAINEAIKESQKVAAKKLQQIGGGLGGLLGGA